MERSSADILRVDARFVSLLRWLGENHISVRLSGKNTEEGYAVYKIRETAFGGGTKLSAEDGFLQFMIERLLASHAPEDEQEEDEQEELGDDMKLTSLQSITDFMTCAGRTLPDNIRLWARRNLAVARSHEVSPEERRHAQRALSIMMNIQWKNQLLRGDRSGRGTSDSRRGALWHGACEAADYRDDHSDQPDPHTSGLRTSAGRTGRNRKVPDRLCGGKDSEAAVDYAGHELHQRPGAADRKLPCLCQCKAGYYYGSVFHAAGESNLVFIINELDKAASGKGNGNPADVLLTLLDNLGFTDNYMECMVPTVRRLSDRDGQ